MLLRIVALAALIAVPAGLARADDTPLREHRSTYARPASQPPAPPACRPLCENDLSPCDPVQFKAADGRCASPLNGSAL